MAGGYELSRREHRQVRSRILNAKNPRSDKLILISFETASTYHQGFGPSCPFLDVPYRSIRRTFASSRPEDLPQPTAQYL